jgi:hypothetical protein
MVEPFDTNRDPGDEQPPTKGKDYYLVLDENGCLDIPNDQETDVSSN